MISKRREEKQDEVLRNPVNLQLTVIGWAVSQLVRQERDFLFLTRRRSSTGISAMRSEGGGEKDGGAGVAREGEKPASEAEGFSARCVDTSWARSQWRRAWRVSFDVSVA